jgi:dihydropteroate synthase
MYWQTSRYQIDLTRPQVMGIVNVTPDSFSDGGQHGSALTALKHCEQLIRDGADILDIGGESTRPGSSPVSLEDELDRVLPVLREAVRLGVPVSLDSYKPAVMQAALDLGADIINDIWGPALA